MKLKFCCVCSIILLCTNALGMGRFKRDYSDGQRRSYFQKSNGRENFRRYDYNKYDRDKSDYADYKGRSGSKRRRGGYSKYDYTDYEAKPGSTYRKDSYNNAPDFHKRMIKYDCTDYEAKPGSTYRRDSYNNAPDLHKRMIKKRQMLNKEREGIDLLFNGYDYQDALNFFKEVGESESSYPTLIWDDDYIDADRPYKVDFGKFDQRQEFVDMFENCDGRGVSNCMRVEFSYGGFKHDMFIEQPEKSREYSTDKFLFQNCITFGEEQPLDCVSYLKPYLSKKDKNGILSKFLKYPEKIQRFAINVSRIMKLSPKGIWPIDAWNFDIDRVLTFEAFEVAGMILSTERLRSKKSLLLSCIEFYKLKHTADSEDSSSMLLDMFDKDGPILRFPASPGGVEDIQKTHHYYIYKRFLDMIKYSPEYPTIQQCKNRDIQRELMDKFFHGKLEKIRAVLENRCPRFKSEFKSAVQDYLQGLNTPQAKETSTSPETITSPRTNSTPQTAIENTVTPNGKENPKNTDNTVPNGKENPGNTDDTVPNGKENPKNTDNIAQKAENNPDEYFNDLDNLSDTDYDSIFNSAISSELGSSQQSTVISNDNTAPKIENNHDEYFDELDNLSDAEYESILMKYASQ